MQFWPWKVEATSRLKKWPITGYCLFSDVTVFSFNCFIHFVVILLQVCNTSSPIDFDVNVSGPCIPRCEVEHMNYSNSAMILIPNYNEGDYNVVIFSAVPTMQQCYIDSIKLGEELPYMYIHLCIKIPSRGPNH